MASNYAKDLVWQLSMRGASDQDIREATGQVTEYENRGEDPAQELGHPADYAATFPERHTHSVGRGWATAGVIVGIVWLVAVLVGVGVFDYETPFRARLFALLGALALMVAGAGVGFVAELLKARRTVRRIEGT